MTLFIIGIVAFSLSMLGVLVFLGLWTYKDAQIKSEHSPGLWVAVVLLVPNLLGFIAYLLVGRTKKDVPATHKYRRALIACLVIWVLSLGLFVGSAIRMAVTDSFDSWGSTTINVSTGSTFMTRDSFSHRNNRWTFTARRADAVRSRNIQLSAGEMTSFHVSGESSDGNVFLRVEQGTRVERFDITMFSGYINLLDYGFEPGRHRVAILMEEARDVRVEITWR